MMVRLMLWKLFAATLALGLAGWASPAAAQATRTWVSGVGDDVNPCSRTAPCKTFAGAISKTAAGGEINCLDPGGYGAVTITKSMTISCPYTEGGALAGGNGITINDGATATPGTAVVYLRGLDIFGVNPPLNGVRFIAGAALVIEDSVIRRFNAANSFGVSFQPSGAATMIISNTTISDNGNGATGGGILIQPTGAAGSGRVTLRNVRVQTNGGTAILLNTTGATSPSGTFLTVDDTLVARNAAGIRALVPLGASATGTMIVNSTISNNFAAGLAADGAGATVRVGDSVITGNGTGVTIANGATLASYGDNYNDGNGTDGAFSAGILPKE
jgi:hypothetical protein